MFSFPSVKEDLINDARPISGRIAASFAVKDGRITIPPGSFFLLGKISLFFQLFSSSHLFDGNGEEKHGKSPSERECVCRDNRGFLSLYCTAGL